jgi:hypothetical protein
MRLHAQTKETKRTKNGQFKSVLIDGTRVHFIFTLKTSLYILHFQVEI